MMSWNRLATVAGAFVLASASHVANAADSCFDCECNAAGTWQAWDPEAVGTWPGRTEEAINVRRCAEYNRGSTGGVCTPGDTFNIYMNGAPAVYGPRCEFGVGNEDNTDIDSGSTQVNDGVDRFAKVNELFNAPEATVPTPEELRTKWSGRCYNESRRWEALGGVVFTHGTSMNDGPLFPNDGLSKIFVFERPGEPDAFDTLSTIEVSEIDQIVGANLAFVTTTTVEDNALTSLYLPTQGAPIKWRARKVVRDSQTYYVTQTVAMRASEDHAEGAVLKACYMYTQSRVNAGL